MARRSKIPAGGPPGQRQRRVGELIRRALSDILLRGETHDPDLGSRSITVTEVTTSPDLRHATVYFTPLGGEDTEAAAAALQRNAGALRRLVSRAVTLKYAPDLRFVADTAFDNMDETRRLLNEPRVQRDVRRAGDDADGGADDDR